MKEQRRHTAGGKDVSPSSISLWGRCVKRLADIVFSILGLVVTAPLFLLIAYDLHNADDGNIDLINGVYDYCVENGYRFYCLTASSDDEILRWQDNTGAEYDFCRADDIALKTIIRSNPGLMLLKRGVIYNKWSHNTIPSESELCGRLEDIPVGQMADNGRWQTWVDLCVWYVLPLCLVVVIEVAMFSYRRKRNNHKQQTIKKD